MSHRVSYAMRDSAEEEFYNYLSRNKKNLDFPELIEWTKRAVTNRKEVGTTNKTTLNEDVIWLDVLEKVYAGK